MDPVIDALVEVVGATHVLGDADTMAGYCVDWTGRWRGQATVVVRPGSTAEVSEVVRRCAAHDAVVVPQGGNTGLVGGGVPAADHPTGRAVVVLSLRRLATIEQLDAVAAQLTVGAGVTLADLQAHLLVAGGALEFAVDMASRASATIGGMVATNAGGLHVVRYGPMRAQVLGVEAVLADGSVISRLDGLLKDNTGYDLSQLLVGSEGTLGIVCRARLRLIPTQASHAVALVGLGCTADAVDAVAKLRARSPHLSAAEVMFDDGFELVRRHAGLAQPLPRRWPVYLLVEWAGPPPAVEDELAALAEARPDDSMALGIDGSARARLWAYRERHTEAINALGAPHKLDVTLPLGRFADFAERVGDAVRAARPDAIVVLFGHVGDGNLHVNVVGPAPDDPAVDDVVLRLVASAGGSISAEHGIGRAKVPWIGLTRSRADLTAMRAVKRALDPSARFNTGVIFPI